MYYIKLNPDLTSELIITDDQLKDEPNIYGPYDSQAEALKHLAGLIKDKLKE